MIPLKDDAPTKTVPFVTYLIIAINISVFIYELSLKPEGLQAFVLSTAIIPREILSLSDMHPAAIAPIPLTLVTGMFVHGGLIHIGGNMLFMWIFGDNIEDRFGHFRFIIFYLGAGVIASMVQVLVNPASDAPIIGASGAVAGVLGAYFLLFPTAQVKTLIFLLFFVSVVKIPAVVFLGFWFLIQIASSAYGGGIAWYAHIGGFIAGMATVLVFFPMKKRVARP
jgi:membrane associated rhomboid family serine protease